MVSVIRRPRKNENMFINYIEKPEAPLQPLSRT